MDASGKDDVFIETVGVGQAEIDIVDHGDTVVLVLMPGSGDSIQALKAGVMEIPDIIVVNKADHPMTDTMIREIRGVLALGPDVSWRVPILRTEAARGEGVAELAEKIAEHRAHIEAEGTLEERRARNLRNEVLELAASRMRRRAGGGGRRGPRGRRAARAGRPPRARPGERRRRAAGERAGWLRQEEAAAKAKTKPKEPRSERAEPRLASIKESRRWVGTAGRRDRQPHARQGRRPPRRRRRRRAAVGDRPDGAVAGCAALPFEHVAEGAGRIWAAYERDGSARPPLPAERGAEPPARSSSSARTGGSASERDRAAEVAAARGRRDQGDSRGE